MRGKEKIIKNGELRMDIKLRMENEKLRIEDEGAKRVWRRVVFDF
jgi:hypothetical protein